MPILSQLIHIPLVKGEAWMFYTILIFEDMLICHLATCFCNSKLHEMFSTCGVVRKYWLFVSLLIKPTHHFAYTLSPIGFNTKNMPMIYKIQKQKLKLNFNVNILSKNFMFFQFGTFDLSCSFTWKSFLKIFY